MGLFSLFGRGKKPDPDESVLIQLKRAGSELSKPHCIEFFMYFPSRAVAKQSAPKIKAMGFDVEVRRAAQGSDWLCYATKTIAPDLSAIQKIRVEFTALAVSMGGEYGGWGTLVVN